MEKIIIKNKRLFISGIIFSILLCIGVGVFLLFFSDNQKDERGRYSMTPVWELVIDEVVKVWEQGPDLNDPHFLSQCPEYEGHDTRSEITHCDVDLFKCFYNNRVAKVKYKNDWISFDVRVSSHQKQRKDLNIELSILEGRSIPLRLENSCHQIKLPQGYYRSRFFKRSNKLKDNLWHTSGIEYTIDKYLVRNSEVMTWAKSSKNTELIERLKGSDPFGVSTQLTSTEMQEFCHAYETEVLSAKVHDALTFHHGRQKIEDISNTPPSVNSAPHPFGPRKDDGPQFDTQFNKEGCSKIYSKTCLEEKVERIFPESIGWSGVAELLGGEMEYVSNQYLPRKNLVASSFYFPYKSSWHQAGEFAYWDGKGHGVMNFNFLGERPIIDPAKKTDFKVGFRCMRKRYIGEKI